MSHPPRFQYFVILADMRTGSNLLEACLNSFAGVACLGEVFNPHFIGQPKTETVLGFDKAARDADPAAVVARFAQNPTLAGFRFFHDHDPRALAQFLPDPACAKIILTRNPLDSYISLKIARQTHQWRLGDVSQRKGAQIVFDPAEFQAHVATLQEFQLQVQAGLQRSGQTAFYLSYEDITELDVLNGLAAWLGLTDRIRELPKKLKRQNPEPLGEKLINPEALADGVARLDRFNLARSPSFEPRHPPVLWAYRACRSQPLVYAPVPGCREDAILEWMARIDGVGVQDLLADFTPAMWQDWQRATPRRVAFSVLRHPVRRAHECFVDQVLLGKRENVRAFIQQVTGQELPRRADDLAHWASAQHHAAFMAYLGFVKANLNGQTALPIRPVWASQSRLIEAISAQCPLHRLIREEHLQDELPQIAVGLGQALPPFRPTQRKPALDLAEIYDARIEGAAQAAYGHDYALLAFGPWRSAA
jgi:LPS sulfotransferase NodH